MPLRFHFAFRSFAFVGVVLLAVFAVLPSSVFAGGHRAASTGLRTVAFAQAPPDFAFDLGAGPERLREYRGKAVVVNFWATWCEPCAAELETFARLQETYGARIPLLAISDEAPGIARDFLVKHHIDARPIEDPARKIFAAYSVSAIPVTLVLGRDGTVSHVSIGQIDWEELQTAVEAAGGEPSGDHAP